ncbi:MAG: tRNA pseudouridine(38-40) synthase TruA [Suipraeoptans sp.]
MKRIALKIAYDGTNYCGWQIQKNGITIEEVLNKTLSKLTGENVVVIGASRTDSGVHSMGNVAIFDTESTIPPNRFSYALNQRLPSDIRIVESVETPSDWHPRYQHEISKTYEYHILNSKSENPLRRLYATYISFDLNIDNMIKGAGYILGKHDFVSFCNMKSVVEDTTRTITDIKVTKQDDEIIISVTGDGFLYNMVRIIAGVLIRVGRGFYEPVKVAELIEARTRTNESVTAPANGLVLVNITYKEDIFQKEC